MPIFYPVPPIPQRSPSAIPAIVSSAVPTTPVAALANPAARAVQVSPHYAAPVVIVVFLPAFPGGGAPIDPPWPRPRDVAFNAYVREEPNRRLNQRTPAVPPSIISQRLLVFPSAAMAQMPGLIARSHIRPFQPGQRAPSPVAPVLNPPVPPVGGSPDDTGFWFGFHFGF